MYKTLFLVLVMVMLTGCPFDGEPDARTTPMPALDRSTDLAGPDIDQDGVRDDIAAWIMLAYSEPAQRRAAMQSARAMQRVFTVDLANRDAVKEVNRGIVEADSCIFAVFDPEDQTTPAGKASQDLESIATNTRSRLKHYLAFNKVLDGSTWTTPNKNTCE